MAPRLSDEQRQEVFVALGAVSACWENLPGAGLFLSTEAQLLGERLCDLVAGWVHEAGEQATQRVIEQLERP